MKWRYLILLVALATGQCARPLRPLSPRAEAMPYCCDDADCIFADDYEDGAPLSAKYQSIVGGGDATVEYPILQAGAGINSSKGLKSNPAHSFSGVYDDVRWWTGDTLAADGVTIGPYDKCGNLRTDFAFGGWWYFDPALDSSVLPFQLTFAVVENTWWGRSGNETAPGGGVVFLDRGNLTTSSPDLVLLGANDADELGRVPNLLPSGVRMYLEFRGHLNSKGNPDGSIEVRKNGQVYPWGVDAHVTDAIVKSGVPQPTPCKVKGLTFVDWTVVLLEGVPNGWDRVHIYPQGQFDCLYVKDRNSYCVNRQTTASTSRSGQCPPSGPGGSPGQPRAVQPGGYPVTAADDSIPAGGGIPSTASDPSVPQVRTAVSQISLDVTLVDGTVRRYSLIDGLPQAGRAPADGRILAISPIEYALSDRFGSTRAQTWTVTLADPDGLVRGDLDSSTNRFYKRWQAQAFGESDAARLAGTARVSLARGKVLSVTTNAPLEVTLTITDELSYPNSPFSLERQLPHVLIGDAFAVGMTGAGLLFQGPITDQIASTPLPEKYGEMSDEWRLAQNDIPAGINKAFYVGDFLLASGSQKWHGFAVNLYANKKWVALFGSNGAATTDASGNTQGCDASVRLDPSVFTVGNGPNEFLVPGLGSWSSYFATNYNDLTTKGVTRRVSMFFGRGPVADAAVNGKVPLSVNLWGKETVGDSTGTLIDDAAYIIQDLVERPILQRALIGNEAAPTFSDGISRFKTSSAVAVTAIHHARRSGGYKMALSLDGQQAARDWLATALVSADCRLYIDTDGRICLTTFDDSQTLASLPAFVDVTDIRGDTFKVTSERAAELENAVQWDSGPEPATGRTSLALQTTAGTGVANWSADSQPFKGGDVHLHYYRDAGTALDVVARRLLKTQDGITRGELAIDLSGFSVTPGAIHRVTDFRGLGASGWTQRVLLAEAIVFNPNLSNPPQAEDLGITIRWEDTQLTLVAPVGLVGSGTVPGAVADGTTTPAVGFQPIGDTASGTGWTVYDSTNGWRVG